MSCEVKVKYLNLSLVTVTNKSSLDTICINTSPLKLPSTTTMIPTQVIITFLLTILLLL